MGGGAAKRRLRRSLAAVLRLGLSSERTDGADDGAGNGDRQDTSAHARPRSVHHLVPFVVRQPATSNYVCLSPSK